MTSRAGRTAFTVRLPAAAAPADATPDEEVDGNAGMERPAQVDGHFDSGTRMNSSQGRALPGGTIAHSSSPGWSSWYSGQPVT